MRKCSKCGVEKPDSEYYLDAGRLRRDCKVCNRAGAMRRYRAEYAKNPEKWIARSVAWFVANKERLTKYREEWRQKNMERVRIARRRNETRTAKGPMRRAKELNATPAWASKEKILDMYDLARFVSELQGEKYHVDHIVPLKSPLVCGLHVEHNLQVIRGVENSRKKNFHWPEMP